METGYIRQITEQQKQELDVFVEKNCIAPLKLGFKLLWKSGLRVSDLVRLNMQQLDLINRCFRITQKKTGREVTFYLDEESYQYLKAYLLIFKTEIEEHNGYILFSPYSDYHIKEGSIRAVFMKFRDAHGYNTPYFVRSDGRPLYDLSCHVARIRAINKIMDVTGDIRVCRTFAGHKKMSSTMHYLQDAPKEKVREVVSYL